MSKYGCLHYWRERRLPLFPCSTSGPDGKICRQCFDKEPHPNYDRWVMDMVRVMVGPDHWQEYNENRR